MNYRKFGNTGKLVSILGFGCMRFPVIDADPGKIDEAASVRLLQHAVERGINYFDTAWFYHGGNSEAFVGKTFHGEPESIVQIVVIVCPVHPAYQFRIALNITIKPIFIMIFPPKNFAISLV